MTFNKARKRLKSGKFLFRIKWLKEAKDKNIARWCLVKRGNSIIEVHADKQFLAFRFKNYIPIEDDKTACDWLEIESKLDIECISRVLYQTHELVMA